MRTLGNVLLVIAVLCLILFPYWIITSDMPVVALLFPVLLISMGLRFRKWGRGIVQD